MKLPIEIPSYDRSYNMCYGDQRVLAAYAITGGRPIECFFFGYPQKKNRDLSEATINNIVAQMMAHVEAARFIESVRSRYSDGFTLTANTAPLEKVLDNKKQKPIKLSDEERKAAEMARIKKLKDETLDVIEKMLKDPESQKDGAQLLLKHFDKAIEDSEGENYPPQRYLAETCDECKLKRFCIDHTDIECDRCRYYLDSKDRGVEYEEYEQFVKKDSH